MDIWEKINAAQRMQEYIHQNINETISLEGICRASMYSKWHSFRIFKEIFNKTPFEYVRALRLTNAARDIKNDSCANILSVAMNAGFGSHEGFTKAFHSYFGVNPSKYRDNLPMRYMYFEPSPILHYYLQLNLKERIEMAENKRTVTVTVVEKPARKLLLMRGITATDYFSLCAEIGCDKWEALEEKPITGAIDKGAYVELPPSWITPGTSKAALGVEVPAGYDSEIPEGFEVIDLPSFLYMWFQGAPYEDENWFGYAHEEMSRAIANYNPGLYGYEFAKDSAPHFQYGTSAATGVREMIPVRRLTEK